MSLNELIKNRKLIVGDTQHSDILKVIEVGQMPPEFDLNGNPMSKDRFPSRDEVQSLRSWVSDCSKSPQTEVFSKEDEEKLIEADLLAQKNAEEDLEDIRYISLGHLYNSAPEKESLPEYLNSLSLLLNSLSWNEVSKPPVIIGNQSALLRIRLSDYGWSPVLWNRLQGIYPYKTNQYAKFTSDLGTSLPVVKGDWLAFNLSRPPLYHDFLKLPLTIGELSRRLGVDLVTQTPKTVNGIPSIARSGFPGFPEGSQVSFSNRIIERRIQKDGRAFWNSYDFKDEKQERNIFDRPLGPGGTDGFTNDGGETIFRLPNGLQAYYLYKALGRTGTRINEGPPNVVYDHKRNEVVTNGISCFRCHENGIVPRQDKIRSHYLSFLEDSPQKSKALAIYPEQTVLDTLFKDDSTEYLKAVDATKLYSKIPSRTFTLPDSYEKNPSLEQAAIELGTSPEELNALAEKASFTAKRELERLKSGATTRKEFELIFQTLQSGLRKQ